MAKVRKRLFNNEKQDPRSESRPESRDLLIMAAKPLFAKKGFDGATVKDLADAAGVNVSLVSYYFGGKEGLYRSCIEQFGRERLAAAERMLSPAADLAEFQLRLSLFAEEFFESQLDERDVCTILHREFDQGNPIAQSLFANVFAKVSDKLREFIAAGQRSGILRKNADAEIVTHLIFGSLIHAVRSDKLRCKMRRESIESPAHRARVVENVSVIFTNGLALASHIKPTERKKETNGSGK